MGLFTGLSPALQEELLAQTLIDLDQVETEAGEMVVACSAVTSRSSTRC